MALVSQITPSLIMKIVIGTRGSELALWQARYTQARLTDLGVESELKIITTKGDAIQHLSFDKIEGKGFFTKEIEEALIAGEIDLAVHSLKDMPTSSVEGLMLAGISERANPQDWLVIKKEAFNPSKLFGLKDGAVVGSSSARRKAQLLHYRNDLTLNDIRGNVPTRLRKLEEGNFDAIMLAAAGLTRLNLDLSNFHVTQLNVREFIPAPAQGVLAWQVRKNDQQLIEIARKLHSPKTLLTCNIERKVLKLIGGGCHIPLGVYCELDTMGHYHVWAAFQETPQHEMKFIKCSSTTSANLAEEVLAELRA